MRYLGYQTPRISWGKKRKGNQAIIEKQEISINHNYYQDKNLVIRNKQQNKIHKSNPRQFNLRAMKLNKCIIRWWIFNKCARRLLKIEAILPLSSDRFYFNILSLPYPQPTNYQILHNIQICHKFQKIQKQMSSYHYLFKFIVIGDSGVGKSCVVLQLIQQKMNNSHDVTIGVQFAAKNLKINRKNIKLQIWDTAGQQNFRSITRSYYRSAIGALLIYDITRRETFEHLQEWMEQVKSNGNQSMQVLLIGNKTDLQSQRQVTYQQGKSFAAKQKLKFLEITATDYKKVQAAFNTLAESILNKIDKGQISELATGIKVSEDLRIDPLSNSNRPKQKQKCC